MKSMPASQKTPLPPPPNRQSLAECAVSRQVLSDRLALASSGQFWVTGSACGLSEEDHARLSQVMQIGDAGTITLSQLLAALGEEPWGADGFGLGADALTPTDCANLIASLMSAEALSKEAKDLLAAFNAHSIGGKALATLEPARKTALAVD